MSVVGVARAAVRTGIGLARQLPVAGPLLDLPVRVPLEGQVVLVTGAARGLGAELARQAHARGASVALVGRDLTTLEPLAAGLGDRAAAFEADISDLGALQRVATEVVERFGGIDVVIANAGIAPSSHTVLTIDPVEFERTIDIDLLGQWRTVRATLPALIERQGHVLVVASVYAVFNGALNASYAMSKAGLEQLVRALRVELAPHRATAGIAYLGFIDTELATEVFEQDHVQLARRAAPAFATRPMPVEHAAKQVLDGIERRSPQLVAPAWVAPLLISRGVVTAVMDEIMIGSSRLAAAIRQSEATTPE